MDESVYKTKTASQNNPKETSRNGDVLGSPKQRAVSPQWRCSIVQQYCSVAHKMRLRGAVWSVLCVWTAGVLHVTLAECPHEPTGKTLRRWTDENGWTSLGQTVCEHFPVYYLE